MRSRLFLIAAVLAAGLGGIVLGFVIGRRESYAPPPLVPGQGEAPAAATYRAVTFADLPGWASDRVMEALPALMKSCEAFADRPTTDQIGGGVIGRPVAAWLRACGTLTTATSDDDLRRRLEKGFAPYAVTVASTNLAGARSDGSKFTGYYEADLRGSFTQQGPYQVPIYGVPRDLVTVDLKRFVADLPQGVPQKIVGHVNTAPDGNALVPYFTRRQIDREHALADRADVLLWSDDPVAVHILHIQGSGRVTLADGKIIHVGFAGHNGLAFRGIGSILIAAGILKRGEANMDAVRTWLRDHPAQAAGYLDENARYIFFRLTPESDTSAQPQGPLGALGVALTPERSLAVDPRSVPLGAFVWLDTTAPDGALLQRLVAAQDIGAAIVGPVRGDFFWGHGESAFAMAARMNSPGRYFVLVPVQ